MKYPKGYTNHVVLIVCGNTAKHEGRLLLRYMVHGWGTFHYWFDSPTMAEYHKVKLLHPEYDEDEIVVLTSCRVCTKSLLKSPSKIS